MKFKILYRRASGSNLFNYQELYKRSKATAMLILLRVRLPILSNEKNEKIAAFPALYSLGERTADFETKPALVSAFLLFRLKSGKQKYLSNSQGIGNR